MSSTERRAELAAFLRAARARVTPADAGLPGGGTRRTPGLRRQEVAELAAVSIDWYIRLEQGRAGTPSTGVLDGIAGALRLNDTERAHLHLLARGEAPAPRHRPAPVSPSLRLLLEGMPLLPAYVVDFRFDILAHNAAASALFGPDFGSGAAANAARMLFTVPETRAMQLDWERVARETVGNLRANLARHGGDARLRALVAELTAAEGDFARWWEDRTVEERSSGRKRLLHPVVGELALGYEYFATLDAAGHRLVVVTPADATTEQRLRTLVSAHTRSLTGTGLPTPSSRTA